MLTSNSKSKNKKINGKENRNEKINENKQSLLSSTLTERIRILESYQKVILSTYKRSKNTNKNPKVRDQRNNRLESEL